MGERSVNIMHYKNLWALESVLTLMVSILIPKPIDFCSEVSASVGVKSTMKILALISSQYIPMTVYM